MGGQVVDKQIFAKHVVAIYNVRHGVICTGTIIAANVVLTAAHCVSTGSPGDYQILFTKSPRPFGNVTRKVTQVRMHDYNPASYSDRKDLALVRFRGDLPAGYEPMPLPNKRDLEDMGRNFYATGYGVITGRQDLPDREPGILRYTHVSLYEKALTPSLSQFTVNQQNGRGICFGDSGGPAFVKLGDRRIIIGVASAVYSLDKYARTRRDFDICRYQAIYISTYYYSHWIQKTSAELAD